jgi:hypothetical protein
MNFNAMLPLLLAGDGDDLGLIFLLQSQQARRLQHQLDPAAAAGPQEPVTSAR